LLGDIGRQNAFWSIDNNWQTALFKWPTQSDETEDVALFSTLVSSPKDIAYIHPVSILSKSDITFTGENFDSMCLEIPGYKTEINALSDIKARVFLTVN
jgi:hypothetical protein